MHLDITTRDYKTLKYLLNAYLPGTTVWAFGSRVKFASKPESDLDLVAFIESEQENPLAELKDAFAESDLPFRVDILDWEAIPDNFKQNIKRDYVVVKDANVEKEAVPDDWKTYKLSEITNKIGSGSTPRGGKGAYLVKSEISLIRSQNVLDFSFSKNGLAFISVDQANELRNVTIEKGDVLLNITGDSVARVCKVPDELIPARVNQHVAIIRANKKKVDSDFLKYYLLMPFFKNNLLGLASSGATRNALTKAMIENLKIAAPDLQSQRSLSNILSSLDEKIDLNRLMNQTLESIAQGIFQEWFVNFNFPGFDGELVDGLPKGWRFGKLHEIAKIEIGRTPPRVEGQWFSKDSNDIKWISIRDLGQGGIYIFNTSEYLTAAAKDKFRIPEISENTVVLSFKLTIGRLAITTEKMLSNEAIAQINSTEFSSEYLYCYLKTYPWDSLGSTSSIASAVNSKIIKDMPIVIPESTLSNNFSDLIKPIFEKLRNNSQQIETLIQLRDSLLPKLMTGKIEVKT